MTNWNALVGKLFALQRRAAESFREPRLMSAPNPPAAEDALGKTIVSSRFIVMLFPIQPQDGASPCWDCMSGTDLRYPSFGAWAEDEAAAISYALREELADRHCLPRAGQRCPH
ncbi:hypothetical protein ACQP1O_07015 [Nocardia sp. CA-151230]|uniref:hypothetical protein n=1 Tax=Nocardia sp. CA-151230 TaxID=3239982 RepID=UPI003D8E7C05